MSQQGSFPRGTAFAASLVVPGLGQHLQGRSNRGWLYMGLAGVPGILALWANSQYNGTLDDYKELRTQLAGKTGDELTPVSGRDRGVSGDVNKIYIMNPDGTNQKRITSHNKDDFAPSWSPLLK